jgi:hypothetical protein
MVGVPELEDVVVSLSSDGGGSGKKNRAMAGAALSSHIARMRCPNVCVMIEPKE